MAYYQQHSFCGFAEGFSTLPENYRNNPNYAVYNLNPNTFVCGWNVYEPVDGTTTVSSRKSYSVEEVLSRNSEVWNYYNSGRFDVQETVGNNFNRKIVLREKPKPCERVNWKVKNYTITLYHETKQIKNDDHLLLVSQWGCGSVFPSSQLAHIPIQAQAQSFSGTYSGSYARSHSSSVYRNVGTPTTEVVDVEINTSECVKVPSPVPVPVPIPQPRPITPPKPCNICNENVSISEYKSYYDSLNKGSSYSGSNNNSSTYQSNNYTTVAPISTTSNYNYDATSYNVPSTANNNASAYDYNSTYNSAVNNNNSNNYYDRASYNYDSSSYNYDDQSYAYDEDSYSYPDQYDYENYSNSSAYKYYDSKY